MAIKLGDVFVALGLQEQSFNQGLDNARKRVNGFVSQVTNTLNRGLSRGFGGIPGLLQSTLRAAISELGPATRAASNLNETIARTQAVFGDSSRDILAWSRNSAQALGVSQRAALDATTALGNMFDQLGASTQDSATFSKDLVTLAADLTAFHNVAGGTPEVLQAIQSAFRGELDPLQRYIPTITAAAVQQQALADTGKESAEQLTALDKAIATQTIIFRDAGAAIGAYNREINSAASQERIFIAAVEEWQARIGQTFLPIRQAFFRGLNELVADVEPYGVNILDSFAAGLARGLRAILPVLAELREHFIFWLKPGSPPRLLPELVEWGRMAMQEYLRGWGEADTSALQTLGDSLEQIIRSFAASGTIAETDLVGRVFGSRRAIVDAIREFRELGSVSETALSRIADAAGPAGAEIAGLVREYFELQEATRRVSDAQDELNAVTQRYSDALNPLNDQLDAVRARQQKLREDERLAELGKILRDPRATVSERERARLEAEEIALERQVRALEAERDTAVDAAQSKVDAAKQEEEAQRQKFNAAQAALDQQVRVNQLIAEEVALRKRLADEAMAAEEARLRELEAAQREAAAEAERVADAVLRWRLASTDTAGQLAIMRDELAKTQAGSAEYYDILVKILQLEGQLARERDSNANNEKRRRDQTQQSELTPTPGVQSLIDALDELFGTLSGETPQPEPSPFFQQIFDTIDQLILLVNEAVPIVKNFFAVLRGEDPADPISPTDPFAGTFWAGILPGMQGLVLSLEQFRNEDWAGLWARFKSHVDGVLERTSDGSDPRTFTFYTWLRDTAIPLLETLAEEGWAGVWDKYLTPVKTIWDAIVDYIDERIAELTTAVQAFIDLLNSIPGFAPEEPSVGGGGGGGFDDGPPANAWEQYWRNRMNELHLLFPQNFNMPAPSAPGFTNGGPTTINNYFINQEIGVGGDFGGARAGAQEGIREALLRQRTT